jgi:HEAT repeat protein
MSDAQQGSVQTELATRSRTSEILVFEALRRSILDQHWPEVVRLVQVILSQEIASGEGQNSRSKKSIPNLSPTHYQTVLDALLLSLEWGDFQVRWEVAKMLPTLGEGAIEPLLSWLQDEDADADVQWFVVRMLGSWAGDGAIDRLLEVLQSDNPELQAMALSVLIQQGNRILDRLKPLLIQSESRILAVQILAGIRSRDTLDLLLTVVADDHPEIRMMALEALSSFQDDRLGPVFITAIADPITSVRQTAAMAIGFCQTLPIIDRVRHLTPLLWDLQIPVCCAAASSLGRLGHSDAIGALRKALFSHPLPINLGLELVRSLFHIGNVEAIESVSDYLTQTFAAPSPSPVALSLVSEILRLLGRIESSSNQDPIQLITLSALLDSLCNPNLRPNDRILAITSLGQLKDVRSIDFLIRQLTHPSPQLRLHILHALQQINAPIAHQKLKSHQSNPTHPAALQSGIHFALTEWR